MKTVISHYTVYGTECTRVNTYTLNPEGVKVVKLLCLAYTYKEIAEKLYVTVKTVHARMSSLYRYYDLPPYSRLALLNRMVQDGVITLPITEEDV